MGSATVDVVDATHPDTVDAYVDGVVGKAGQVDIVFNAIGGRLAGLGYPALSATQDFEQFLTPLRTILGSTFLTPRVAASPMAPDSGGAVVTLSPTLSVMTAGAKAEIAAVCGAVEALTRSLVGEFGPACFCVNGVPGSAMSETRTIRAAQARLFSIDPATMRLPTPPLDRHITVAKTAATAAFFASNAASGVTGHVVTVSAGAFVN